MNNQELIDKYRSFTKAQRLKFSLKTKGEEIPIDGIINPLSIDNRPLCSMTQNQGDTPYCAAYSAANYAEAIIWKKTGKIYDINPEQIYAGAKQIDGIINDDGTFIETALQSAFKLGCFDLQNCKIMKLVNTHDDEFIEKIKFAIHKYDLLLGGWMISDTYYDIDKNNFYLDKIGKNVGGHCMVICGYDQSGIYIQNSWGVDFGANGFFIESWDTFKKDFIYAGFIANIFDNF